MPWRFFTSPVERFKVTICLFIDARKKQIEVQMFEKCADNLENEF